MIGQVNRTGGVEVVARIAASESEAAQVSNVRFQYRSGGAWIDMIVVDRQTNPSPYRGSGNINVHWNAASLPLGMYELRAVPLLKGGVSGETCAEIVTIELVGNQSDASISSEVSSSADTILAEQEVFHGRKDTVTAATPSGQMVSIVLDSGAAPAAPETAPVKLRVGLFPPGIVDTSKLARSATNVGLLVDLSFSDSGQPDAGIWITIPLPELDNRNRATVNGVKVAVTDLVVWTLSADTGRWEKLGAPVIDLVAKNARFRATHFSFFTLAAPVAAVGNLASFVVYPNPFKPNDGDPTTGVEYQAGIANTGITFENLPVFTRVQVFTPLGERVADATVDASGGLQWDVRNGRGEKVASGVYVYIVTAPSGERRMGKIMVVR